MISTLLTLSTLIGCASGQDSPPPGGPADKSAPTIRETDPIDGSVNVATDEVTITFSESINSAGVAELVVVTPLPEKQPEVRAGGRDLTIRFAEPLTPNRTYAVTVGGGLSDRAGNRLGTPLTIRFSTGPIIDSGRIRGDVIGQAKRETYLFAWLLPDDVDAFNDTLRVDQTRPDFITPAGDDGAFSLEGLPDGRYRLIAVADAFRDRVYSPRDDAFGVAAADVEVREGKAIGGRVPIRLAPGPIDAFAPQLLGAVALSMTATELRFSEPIDTSGVRPEDVRLSIDGRDVPVETIWRPATTPGVLQITHRALPTESSATVTVTGMRDSLGLPLDDTARSATFRTTARADTIAPRLLLLDSVAGGIRFSEPIRFGFTEPIVFDGDPAVTLRDTTTGTLYPFRVERLSAGEFRATILDTTSRLTNVELRIDLGRFRDRAGNRTDSTWRAMTVVRPIPQLGSLSGRVVDSLGGGAPHIITLKAADGPWTYTIKAAANGAWEIGDIPSGRYEISAFRDANRNGVFDYGSLAPFMPGEVFVEIYGGVMVRPRWTTTDVELRL